MLEQVSHLQSINQYVLQSVKDFSRLEVEAAAGTGIESSIDSLKNILQETQFALVHGEQLLFNSGLNPIDLEVNLKKLEYRSSLLIDVGPGMLFGFRYHEYKIIIFSENGKIDPAVLELAKMKLMWLAKEKELVEKEYQIREDRERLHTILQSIDEGVIASDRHDRILLMNPKAEQITGWSREEIKNKTVDEVLNLWCPTTGEKIEHPIQWIEQNYDQGVFTGEVELIHRDGSQRTVVVAGAPLKNARGEVVGNVLALRDITRQKKMEEELFKAEKLETVGVLAGGIAHDFNNFLTIMLSSLNMAEKKYFRGEDITRYFHNMSTAIERATALTQQLLTFSKGGAPVLRNESIRELIVDSVDFALRGSQCNYQLNIADDLYFVEMDSGQINQVINNIVINAKQAMEEGGTIYITAQNVEIQEKDRIGMLPPGRYVQVSIRDEGVGIPPEIQKKIFDPFFTTKEDGNGLGLASAYAIIKKHHGYITVDSRPGQGATFTFYLPAAEAPQSQKQTITLKKSFHLKVLVMDDDELIRNMAAEMLESLNCRVEMVSNGEEAIAQFQKHLEQGAPFDLVLLDLTVPGHMGGKEAIKHLRKLDSQFKAVVMSGYSNDPVLSNFREYDFDGFLCKPFRMDQLSEVLETVLETV